MEDDLRLEALHHLEHPVALLAVGEHGLDPGEVPLLDHLAVDPEEVVLGVVEHDQQLRAHPGDLADQLGADRAARAGDQDDLVLEVGADAVELHHHRLAAEHVLDLDLAQLLGELDAARGAARRPSAACERGRRARGRRSTTRPRSSPGAEGIAMTTSSGWNSSRISADLVGGAEHLDAVQPHAALARVVVEEADRAGAEVRVELQLAHDHLAARAGADDQHAAARRRRRAAPAARPAASGPAAGRRRPGRP